MKPVPSYNHEAEQSVLGAVLLHPACLARVQPVLVDEAFHHPAHRAIWEAVLDCERRGVPVDPVSVGETIRRLGLDSALRAVNGVDYLGELMGCVVTVENVEHHARIIARKAHRRHLTVKLSELVAKGFGEVDDDEFLTDAEKLLVEAGARQRDMTRAAKLGTTLRALIGDLGERYHRAKAGGTIPIVGVPTGFANVDKLPGGWRAGDQIVIAARPSMGKTALVMNAITSAALLHGVPALVFSAEMPSLQLAERMVAGHGRVDTTVLRNGTLTQEDWVKVNAAATDLSELPIEIDDSSGLTVNDVKSRARHWRATSAKDASTCVIAVDYLQLLEPTNPKQQREQQVSEISRGLKSLAKELGCPVISLAQLNRQLETRDDKRPRMSDLRDSGSIEQDADIIAFLYRDDMYDKAPHNPQKGIAELIFGKFRGGPLATLWLDWDDQHTTFTARWAPPPSKLARTQGKRNGGVVSNWQDGRDDGDFV